MLRPRHGLLRIQDVRAGPSDAEARRGLKKRLTGSSRLSQKPRSITVTTRPGASGVPRWSVLMLISDSLAISEYWECVPGLVKVRDD